MHPNDAAAARAQVDQTETKLAERARWPFYRHALFGLAEGLVVAGVAQPVVQAGTMTAVALALMVVCVAGDRRRDGMFVSGWRAGATRPLTILLTLFVLAMAMASVSVRDGEAAQPFGYLLGAIAFAVCTAASLRWEKIYRAELGRGAQR